MIHIYHHNDLDGMSSAGILAYHLYKQRKSTLYGMKFYSCSYKELDTSNIKENDTVYILDYSFTEATKSQLLDIYNKCNKHLIWIDHHDSSIELQKSNDETIKSIDGIRSKQGSGVYLTYVYMNDMMKNIEKPMYAFINIPTFILYISDYDTFSKALIPQSDWFKYGMDTHNINPTSSIWQQLMEDYDKQLLSDILEDGKLAYKYAMKELKSYYKSYGFDAKFEGYDIKVINRRTNSSAFGEDYKKADIVMSYVYDGNLYKYSIFSSKEDIDCSKLAEKYGGGGHKGAAGFSSNTIVFES